jgi:hypothetical protein
MGRYSCVAALLVLLSGCGSILPQLGSDTDCTGQGRQLDPVSKQCVVAPTPQVVRSPAKPQPRTVTEIQSYGVAVERDAAIDETLRGEAKLVSGLVGLVRARGYQCDTISAIEPIRTSNGFKLTCNHFAHRYEIENKSGDWAVAIR